LRHSVLRSIAIAVCAAIVLQSRDERRQPFLEFAAEDRVHSKPAQIRLIHRRVQPVKTKPRPRIHLANRRQQRHPEPRRCVHRHVKRNQIRRAHGVFIQLFARHIEARHLRAALPQPGRRRRQPKRLVAQLIRRNQHYVHRVRHHRISLLCIAPLTKKITTPSKPVVDRCKQAES
jgi:hypothetical protein